MTDGTASFQAIIRDFFIRYLAVERGASPNTIASYRDAIKLFVRYAAQVGGCTADRLEHDALGITTVRGFLDWLDTERHCGPRTRNQRLAVLKSLAGYMATVDPRHLERCRAIRELPRARFEQPEPSWLDAGETTQLVEAVRTAHRERDRALIMLLYDTGARVQEAADLNVGDVHTDGPAFIQFRAKGGKQRTNILGAATVQAVSQWCELRGRPGPEQPLFVNTRGTRLTRSGIAWILKRTVDTAGLQPTHAVRVTPHVIRHTTAMHLVQSGVDITTVAAWMGHASLDTTNGYVQITLRMKQEALAELAQPAAMKAAEYPDDELIDWLDGLARTPRYVQKLPAKTLKSRT